LFQLRPKKRLRSLHYTEDGWYTLDGFIYEADKLSRCVQWAKRRYFTSEFTYFASINFTEDMTAAEMKAVWSKACRYLTGKNVVALYTCEVSRRSNHFNFHMLLRSRTPNLSELLKFATKTVKTNIKVEPYDPGRGRLAVRYMTKARTPKYKNGEIVSRDRWARKRVLLRQELKMRKYGFIGQFWPVGMNKDIIWKEIIAHEKKISDGLQQPGAEEYAREMYELTQGFFSLSRVRRSVGYFGVPSGWVPKLDDDLVVRDEVDVQEPEVQDHTIHDGLVAPDVQEAHQHAPTTPKKAIGSPRPHSAWVSHQKRFTGHAEGKDDILVQEPRPPPQEPRKQAVRASENLRGTRHFPVHFL
jgi:hypothetical protein